VGLQLRKRMSVRASRAGLMALGVATVLTLSGCSDKDREEIRRLAQPVGASDRSDFMHSLWMWAWLAAIVVGILVWGLIGYCIVKYRRRSNDEIPVQTRYNLPMEILYTIAPVVMVLVFFYWTVRVQDDVLADVAHPDHTIDVVGEQWAWTFNYVADKDLDSKTTVFQAGSADALPTLYLPINESVRFNLSSPDVIHSFWVPGFLQKLDVIPGLHNSFDLTPTRLGTYRGRCAELCGVYHSRMLFDVKIVTPQEYAANLKRLQAEGNTGLALGGSEARTIEGLEQNGGGE
jgi:cytochrome c oxidase subunit II